MDNDHNAAGRESPRFRSWEDVKAIPPGRPLDVDLRGKVTLVPGASRVDGRAPPFPWGEQGGL